MVVTEPATQRAAALSKEETLVETARFAAVHAGLYTDQPASAPWLVTGAVLMAQQAAALALVSAGDGVPDQSGATELILRAASRDRLAPPYTLPLPMAGRQAFDRLVEARNMFMHPRAVAWHVSPDTLSRGLAQSTRIVRHLVLTQPVVPDLVAAHEQAQLRENLEQIDALAEFLST